MVLEVLVRKFPSPLYTAVILCVAADKDAVGYAASPPVRFTLPRVVCPSEKVTLPVGFPSACPVAATTAVKVTDCPHNDGLTDDEMVVEVGQWVVK